MAFSRQRSKFFYSKSDHISPPMTFNISRVGELCENPVETKHCQMAAEYFPNATYAAIRESGFAVDFANAMPYGCIWDTVTQDKTYVYWNPNGSVLSNDRNIRQICYSTTPTE